MDKEDVTKVQEMYYTAINKMDQSDYQSALNIAYEIKNFIEPQYYVSNVVGGLLIDIGRALNREDITKEGLDLINNDLEQIVKNLKDPSIVYYNLANGYYNLFSFKWDKNPYFNLFNKSELDDVKKNHRKALKYNSKNPKIFVNLGNCYDHLGRNIDALECYEKALELKPDHAMALGNKGIALCRYAFLLGKKYRTLLLDAHYFITKALEIGVNPESKESFITWLQWIERYFEDKNAFNKTPNFPGYKIEAKSKFNRYLKENIMKEKLYLNVCSFCQKCNASIGDTINIERVMNKIDKEYSTENDPYLRLSSHLNHIKEDYMSARFLLILSGYQDLNLDFVYEDMSFVNTLDHSLHNMDLQLLRLSFKNYYDILDKIAFFINDYLDLKIPDTKIDFRKIWYAPWKNNPKKSKINEKIIDTGSNGLNALYDIHWDFEKDGPYNDLRRTRNTLTHRYVNIKKDCNEETSEKMTVETFLKQTVELASIVRNSIFYLMYFVFEIENKKLKEQLKNS
jgi:tetratricopeptide (TPR) repeat protein